MQPTNLYSSLMHYVTSEEHLKKDYGVRCCGWQHKLQISAFIESLYTFWTVSEFKNCFPTYILTGSHVEHIPTVFSRVPQGLLIRNRGRCSFIVPHLPLLRESDPKPYN